MPSAAPSVHDSQVTDTLRPTADLMTQSSMIVPLPLLQISPEPGQPLSLYHKTAHAGSSELATTCHRHRDRSRRVPRLRMILRGHAEPHSSP